MKKLTPKEIKNRHTKNPKDKTLHTEIENRQVDKKILNKLILESTKHESFDKKKITNIQDKKP